MAKRKVLKEIIGWLIAIIIPVTLVFILNIFVFTISGVKQESMRNTLVEGDVVYYNRFSSKIDKLKREDIILFLAHGREKRGFFDELSIKITDFKDIISGKGLTNTRYVKRIIGIPGDIIDIKKDGTVYINGEKENKAYVKGLTYPGNMEYPLEVPENNLFVMGDNREVSSDSRKFGCISIHSVEGKAAFIIWPASKVGLIK